MAIFRLLCRPIFGYLHDPVFLFAQSNVRLRARVNRHLQLSQLHSSWRDACSRSKAAAATAPHDARKNGPITQANKAERGVHDDICSAPASFLPHFGIAFTKPMFRLFIQRKSAKWPWISTPSANMLRVFLRKHTPGWNLIKFLDDSAVIVNQQPSALSRASRRDFLSWHFNSHHSARCLPRKASYARLVVSMRA